MYTFHLIIGYEIKKLDIIDGSGKLSTDKQSISPKSQNLQNCKLSPSILMFCSSIYFKKITHIHLSFPRKLCTTYYIVFLTKNCTLSPNSFSPTTYKTPLLPRSNSINKHHQTLKYQNPLSHYHSSDLKPYPKREKKVKK